MDYLELYMLKNRLQKYYREVRIVSSRKLLLITHDDHALEVGVKEAEELLQMLEEVGKSGVRILALRRGFLIKGKESSSLFTLRELKLLTQLLKVRL